MMEGSRPISEENTHFMSPAGEIFNSKGLRHHLFLMRQYDTSGNIKRVSIYFNAQGRKLSFTKYYKLIFGRGFSGTVPVNQWGGTSVIETQCTIINNKITKYE